MHKAIAVKPQDNFNIKVEFSDGKVVLYDVSPLFTLVPSFRSLQSEPDLFRNAKVSDDGTMIIWNDSLNLDAKNIWANGILLEFNQKPDVKRLLAYRIHLARLEAKLTQKELSEKTGVYQADISKLERGLGNPSISTLERLADGLNMELYIDLRHPSTGNNDNLDNEREISMTECDKEVIFMHKTLEERAAEYGGNLGLDGEYDWGEPVGREVW